MTLLAELVAAGIAISLVADGLRKLSHPDAFARWLRSGELGWLAHREVVYALAALEIAVGLASVHPAGRMVAIGVVVLVTPIGAVLVRRTGACACRGVVRSTTASQLAIRNAAVVVAAGASLVVLSGPVSLLAVLVAAAVGLAGLVGRHLLLTGPPVEVVT